MTEMTYAEAAILALQQEMRRDPHVWALGEDIGPEGGIAGQYRGLHKEFGAQRIVDTPISESTIMGAAIGAAVCGTRPVVELRYADFGMCATDEIVNQAAKIRYMFNGQARVPLVVRQAIGIRKGIAAQHSQSTEAWWIHVPGLVVVAPATPADNFGLLKASIRCDDPVIYLEHKELWSIRGEVNPDAHLTQIGKAEVVKKGGDITIVTWSRMRHICVDAAKRLQDAGVAAELIDLRTLWPWDREQVMESVRHTGRLLIVHEAVRVGGFGGEIAAEVGEALWQDLRGPIKRIAGPRSPVPYSEPLEELFRISSDQISMMATDMVRDVAALDSAISVS
jgi:pyruvate/2-oxoglutarate/acetoin dehydrogenase E1 component